MRSLTEEQIDFIAEDIRKRGVFLKNLEDDLLDHICCFIEETEDERPFEQVYLSALERFGDNGLQQIQDETLFLINQPYFTVMKKFAYITGTIASMCLVLGAVFKVQHWPLANALLIIGTLTLTFLFVPYFFYNQYKEQTEKRGRFVSAMGLLTAMLLCAGALFKIMHWPGAAFMILGFSLFFLIFLPLYMVNGLRNPNTRLSSVANGFLFACTGGFLILLSFQNSSKAVTDSMNQIEANQVQLYTEMKGHLSENDTSGTSKALAEFNHACESATRALIESSEEANIGNGSPITPEQLRQVNEGLSQATQKLNTSMKDTPGWSPVNYKPIEHTLVGSVKFQILQYQCAVMTAAR